MHPLTRREFLGALAAGTAWSALGRRAGDRIPAVGIQLYTVRALMAAQPERTLEALAGIGYREVELAGLYGMTAARMRALLDANGLAAPSAHLSLEALRDDWARTLDDARALGLRYVVCPWVNEEDRTLDGYSRLAQQFNAIGERARAAGLQFAFHNHDFVNRPLPDGTVPYDLLLRACDPHLVQMEMDLYWMIAAGGDPTEYFARWPGRFPMLHVKDRTLSGAMTDVGDGTIDFASILAAAHAAGVKHWFVEHDEPKDPLASARRSYAYLSRLESPPTPH
ncbi:MAG TPA: sugar phosphate isomerase/epimerase [Gemmatimonadaceae bacterium]|nr:sugar phosphate isomerase/epimerase [Gemmatimonadaceae bacterium]